MSSLGEEEEEESKALWTESFRPCLNDDFSQSLGEAC